MASDLKVSFNFSSLLSFIYDFSWQNGVFLVSSKLGALCQKYSFWCSLLKKLLQLMLIHPNKLYCDFLIKVASRFYFTSFWSIFFDSTFAFAFFLLEFMKEILGLLNYIIVTGIYSYSNLNLWSQCFLSSLISPCILTDRYWLLLQVKFQDSLEFHLPCKSMYRIFHNWGIELNSWSEERVDDWQSMSFSFLWKGDRIIRVVF